MAQLDPASILGPGGAVARRLPAYELRNQQLEMAQAVARAIERPGHLIVEAGTGVGKSFAYLVPSILAAVEQKKKIVISTHTIALQEQLLRKDLPFLRSVMPQEFSAVLVKGRSNYISLPGLMSRGLEPRGPFRSRRSSTSSARSSYGPTGRPTAPGPTSISGRCRASGTRSRARMVTASAATARGTRNASTSRPGDGSGRPTC